MNKTRGRTLPPHGKDIAQSSMEENQSAQEGRKVIEGDDSGEEVCCEKAGKESWAQLSQSRRQYVGSVEEKEIHEEEDGEEVFVEKDIRQEDAQKESGEKKNRSKANWAGNDVQAEVRHGKSRSQDIAQESNSEKVRVAAKGVSQAALIVEP